jgi:hypothetical protein
MQCHPVLYRILTGTDFHSSRHAMTLCESQKLVSTRRICSPTPYLCSICNVLPWSIVSYALERSKKIWYSCIPRMCDSCICNLASSVAVPVPCSVQNPCSKSWKIIDCCNHLLIMAEQTFHITSNKMIPRVPPEAFGINTSIDHVISCGRSVPTQVDHHWLHFLSSIVVVVPLSVPLESRRAPGLCRFPVSVPRSRFHCQSGCHRQ